MSEVSIGSMTGRLAVIAATLLALCPALHARTLAHTTRTDQAVIDAEDRRFHAQIIGNVAEVDAGLEDDLIYTHATGRVQNKREVLAGMTGKGTPPRAIEAYDRTVHVIGDTGIVRGLRRTTVADRVLVDSYLAVYVRRHARWQLLAWQTSPPPPPSPDVP